MITREIRNKDNVHRPINIKDNVHIVDMKECTSVILYSSDTLNNLLDNVALFLLSDPVLSHATLAHRFLNLFYEGFLDEEVLQQM